MASFSRIAIKGAALLAVFTLANTSLPATAMECDMCKMLGGRHHDERMMFDGGLDVGIGFDLLNRALIAPRVIARGETMDPDTGVRIRVVRTDDGFGTIQRDDGPIDVIRPMPPTKPRKPAKPKPYEVRRLPDGGTVKFFDDGKGTRFAQMQGPDGRIISVDGEIGDRGGNWVSFR